MRRTPLVAGEAVPLTKNPVQPVPQLAPPPLLDAPPGKLSTEKSKSPAEQKAPSFALQSWSLKKFAVVSQTVARAPNPKQTGLVLSCVPAESL